MKTLPISEASRSALAAHAEGNVLACEPNPERGWLATFDDDVLEELMKYGDTIDVAILVVCSGQWGRA